MDEGTVEQVTDKVVFSMTTGEGIISQVEKQASQFFADVKQSDLHLDIRTVWEPARLQHITVLLVYSALNTPSAISYNLKQLCKDALLGWIKANPFLFGPHYISAMECGLRIPVFFYCLKLLDSLSLQEYRMILNTIYLHAWWISRRLSLYSSLGNHTIAECVGLIFAGALFNRTREGTKSLFQ